MIQFNIFIKCMHESLPFPKPAGIAPNFVV